MLSEDSSFVRTMVNVSNIKEELFKQKSDTRTFGYKGSVGSQRDSIPSTAAGVKENKGSVKEFVDQPVSAMSIKKEEEGFAEHKSLLM